MDSRPSGLSTTGQRRMHGKHDHMSAHVCHRHPRSRQGILHRSLREWEEARPVVQSGWDDRRLRCLPTHDIHNCPDYVCLSSHRWCTSKRLEHECNQQKLDDHWTFRPTERIVLQHPVRLLKFARWWAPSAVDYPSMPISPRMAIHWYLQPMCRS